MKPWLAKRIAALLLTMALVALGIYSLMARIGDLKTFYLLAVGIILGTLYTIRGGSLPRFVYRLGRSHWFHGGEITADDDPRNLSPRLYLPILLAAVLAAALIYYFFAPRR